MAIGPIGQIGRLVTLICVDPLMSPGGGAARTQLHRVEEMNVRGLTSMFNTRLAQGIRAKARTYSYLLLRLKATE